MTVTDFFGSDEKRLSAAMALCSDAELSEDGEVSGEPTEAALVQWAASLGLKKPELKEKAPRFMEAPFDSGRKMMSTLHRAHEGIVQFTKGAPDIVIDRCEYYLEDGKPVPMNEEYRQKILAANKAMADRALRVLACAERRWDAPPESAAPQYLEQKLCFVGLCGMIDPVRPEVRAAIEECEAAGIRAIMITGDHVDTAVAIAKELGILHEGERAVTGLELSAMSDEEFEKVFRSIPRQAFRAGAALLCLLRSSRHRERL